MTRLVTAPICYRLQITVHCAASQGLFGALIKPPADSAGHAVHKHSRSGTAGEATWAFFFEESTNRRRGSLVKNLELLRRLAKRHICVVCEGLCLQAPMGIC